MKDVFISYKAEEFDEANWVKSVLENNGISCWMAPSCIPGGSSYAVEIPNAIRGSKVVVLILSTRAQDSKWVSKEIDVALNEGKLVLPFMLENCPLKDDFNFYLTNVQRYAAYENKVAAMEKMIREIKAIIDSAKKTEEPTPKEPVATESQSTEPKWEQPETDKVVNDASNGSIEDKITNKIENIVSARDKFCTASLICGILSIFTFVGFIGIAAMILAILGLKRVAQNGQKGEKFALAGHIIGCVGTFLGMLSMASGTGAVIAIISIIVCSILVKKRYEEV